MHLEAETPGAVNEPRRRASAQDGDQANDVTISTERLQTIESRVESLSNMVRFLQSQSTSGVQSSADLSATDASGASMEESSSHIGHLSRQGEGMTRYIEKSFWAVSASFWCHL
jgi:hypothetical protein